MAAKKRFGKISVVDGLVCKALAVYLLAVAAISDVCADAFWFAGNGDISDVSLWSQDPRLMEIAKDDGTVTTNSVWSRFRTATDGTKDYTLTATDDISLLVIGFLKEDSDLTVRLALAPHTLSSSYTEAIRIVGNPTLRLESGTLAALSKDEKGKYNGSVYFYHHALNATFVVDGPDAVLDSGVNMRDGEFCTTIVTNGGRVMRGIDIHGYSNNRLLVSGAGSLVDYANENFNVGGWHKQGEVIDGTKTVTNNVARICDGGVVTNIADAICGYYGSHGLLDVDGGSLFAKNLRLGISQYSHGNTVRIANGARVVLSDGRKLITVATDTTNPTFGCGQTLLFENYCNDRNDLAGFQIGTSYDWEADYGFASSNHTVKIVNSVLDIPSKGGGFSTYGGANNGIVVSDGSKVSVGLGDNGALVDDGNGITIGGSNASHGNYLIVTGEGSSVSNFNKNSGTRIGARNARGALLEASDGGEFYGRAGMNVGTAGEYPEGGGATVRAARGGRIAVETLSIGKNISIGGQMASNRVEAIDGGLVEVQRLRFFGQGNTVFLSNGTVRVTNEFYTVYGDEEDKGRNTKLVFTGKTPRFEHTGDHHDIYREAIFRYEIPDGGYRTVPYELTYPQMKIAIRDDTKFEFDLTGFMVSGGKTALMKAPKGITFEHRETVETETTGEDGTVTSSTRIVTTDVTAEQLAKWNAALPEGCALYLSNDAETLVPSKDGKGTVLALRAPRRRFTVIVR